MKKIFLYLSITLIFYSCTNNNTTEKKVESINLSDNWTFKALKDSVERTAAIPGSVHLDLLNHKLIPDPFYSDNEHKLQWISEQEWIYTLVFSADTLPNYKNIDLVFEGLDTYAKVFFNDSLLFYSDNMFRKWSLPIDDLLRMSNTIKIHFYNPDSINTYKQSRVPYKLPEIRGFTRKAPFQFGWDWGARFLTLGIWKPVYLQLWDNVKIEDIQITQNLEKVNSAKIYTKLSIYADQNIDYNLSIRNRENNFFYKDTIISIKKGLHSYSIDFQINNPKLWWCNGLGEPYLYELNFYLSDSKQLIDERNVRIGLRTIELVQEMDTIGRSFYFKLNGKSVFIKGSNYVPQDQFLTRVDSNDYKQIVESAIFANMNMLRVWGGGIYESDYFYDLCDENGILLWQDFMFAGTMYPGDPEFMQTADNELKEQIIRLRNHPSIALWCGNNEIDNAWKDWGWQKQFNYSTKDSTELWNNYEKLFHKLIPDLLNKFDTTRNYWPSSPEFGWGHKENFTHGDSHYWGVWWGKEPFEIFNSKVGRFMSEYGFQGIPDIKTINSFAPENELSLTSVAMKSHQKHPIGYETIDEYLLRDYTKTENFEDYIYLSQLLQAEGMIVAIEAHRRSMPYCMGTLYWQLNDSWPVTSWSSIDYFYRYKALHYFVKEAYKETIISAYLNNDNIEIHVVSDDYEEKEVRLEIKQLDFFGHKIDSETRNVNIQENSSNLLYQNKFNDFLQRENSLLYIELWEGDSLLDEDYFYFVKPKDLDLPISKIEYTVKKDSENFIIRLKSDVFAKNIQISTNIEGVLSDNYFDLLAGKEKLIYFTPKQKGKLKIELRTLNNIYK